MIEINMNLLFVSGILITAGVLLFFIVVLIKVNQKYNSTVDRFPYALKKCFFNASEQQFFNILMNQIDHTRFCVFSKVRLGDFIETTDIGDERWGRWNRIKSRHVDFLIFDLQKSAPVLSIEVDGKSHRSQRAFEADNFKNKLYEAVGLRLERVKVGTDFASEITRILEHM